MIILGIETTCDETSASLILFQNKKIEILSNVVLSQDIHNLFGGVLPEQAFRKHQENIIPVLKESLKPISNIAEIDLISVSAYPGLLGALATGVAVAKTIAKIINKPVIPVNHLWAHLLVNFHKVEPIEKKALNKKYLGIVISGGHTNTYMIESVIPLKIRNISKTLDDAVGESFDKVARMLGLGFPGGPIIDKLAQNYRKRTNVNKPLFPIPNPKGYDFSYSGLKTAVKRFLENSDHIDKEEICYHFQFSAIKHIVQKIEDIILDKRVKNILVGGGVASNSFLREELRNLSNKYDLEIYIPEPKLCTDNAAMIAISALFIYLSRKPYKIPFDIYPSEEEGNREIWNIK
ncbi:MAG: tRNA (adenosine(37)-N6)-threonylcarbamoyltransferase complex transferase subunit TsaD [Candidatus Calescibacterium sp.]|nr:tRNA (adenosine(37)-N6)-threonylcarbamoyltransferase complex transferase subunit TsaD [Candidatus Calescibacterium sp.]MCX7972619.1 tRNA (adenosine(37)-N6)-threonylcarbamoyltransferase complex transferase subunit TsaD [bacterium]MDW8194783.1 tRNA (adenosine(37)-N6)-threonylcarbamoyltransferase complex transferase subunit TsaD [Candidatus Calescibacterium sp.]